MGDFNISLVGTDRSNNQINRGIQQNISTTLHQTKREYTFFSKTCFILNDFQEIGILQSTFPDNAIKFLKFSKNKQIKYDFRIL